jgi:hypothetical protein
MNLPPEIFDAGLSSSEFKTIVAMHHLATPEGHVDVSKDELTILTGFSAETLRRSFRGLESAGLLETTRTKRNLGKWSRNVYRLISPSHSSVETGVLPSHKTEDNAPKPSPILVETGHSPSHSSVRSTASSNSDSSNEVITTEVNTSYLLGDASVPTKEVLVEKWRPKGEDTTGDDSLGGFGLFEDEVARKQPQNRVDKRDVRTRWNRPEDEWTPGDVAAEFSHRLSLHYPMTPALINTKDIRGALARWRKQYGITPQIEMEIMRMFFEDSRNYREADKKASQVHTWFLKMFKTHMRNAFDNLGLSYETEDTARTEVTDVLYASDGREFENNISGRSALKNYEERIAKNA